MNGQRSKLKVRSLGTIEVGIHFVDESGKSYLWATKNYNSELFFLLPNEWVTITAMVAGEQDFTHIPILKNVRKVKEL